MLAIKNRVKKYFAGFLALVLAITGCTPTGPRALLEGKRLLEEGQYAGAVEKLKLATSLLNTNAQAWNYLGLAYHRAGDPTNAVQAYQQALKYDRDLVETHFNLGCLWLEQNRVENAKAELAAFTLRRGNSVEAWLKLGTAQLRSRELVAAEKSYGEALRLGPQNPEALNSLGLIQMQRNRPREAAQFFNAALKQQPNYSPALLNVAIVSQSYLNDKQFALQKYREYLALSSRPENWEAVNSTAAALDQELNAGNRPLTMAAAPSPASNIAPSKATNTLIVHANAISKPGPALNAEKITPAVTQASAQVVKVNNQPEARVAQDVSPNTSKSQPADADLDQNTLPKTEKRNFFQKINPLNIFRHGSTPKVKPLSETGTMPETEASKVYSNAPKSVRESVPVSANVARYNYHSLPKLAPGDRLAAEKYLAQGLQEHRANHLPEAVRAYLLATQQDPAYFEAYYNLGLAAAALGDLPQALSASEYALALRPDSAEARLNFAQLLKQAGFFFDAANELAVVLSKNPAEARAHLALGNLYAQQFNQPAKAREHYAKVLEIDARNPQAPAIREWLVAHPR